MNCSRNPTSPCCGLRPVAGDARERAALVVDRVEAERERAGLRAAADRDRTAGRRRVADRRRHRLASGEAASRDRGRAEIGRPLGDLDVRAAEAIAARDQGAPVLGHRRRVIDDQLEAPVLRREGIHRETADRVDPLPDAARRRVRDGRGRRAATSAAAATPAAATGGERGRETDDETETKR